MNPELDRKLRYLRLSGMAATLPACNQEAIHHHLAYPEFLELLVEDELATRRDRLFARRLKQAGVVEMKTLEDYDWSFNPKVPRSLSSAVALYTDVEEETEYIYVADASEKRIVQLDREGAFVRQLQPALGQEDLFRQLSGLFVDETGAKLYFVANSALSVTDIPPVQR